MTLSSLGVGPASTRSALPTLTTPEPSARVGRQHPQITHAVRVALFEAYHWRLMQLDAQEQKLFQEWHEADAERARAAITQPPSRDAYLGL